MGRVKQNKKSTFIDMTAMSDVTVLLLTFFMLTSTFLAKEPYQPTRGTRLSHHDKRYLQGFLERLYEKRAAQQHA